MSSMISLLNIDHLRFSSSLRFFHRAHFCCIFKNRVAFHTFAVSGMRPGHSAPGAVLSHQLVPVAIKQRWRVLLLGIVRVRVANVPGCDCTRFREASLSLHDGGRPVSVLVAIRLKWGLCSIVPGWLNAVSAHESIAVGGIHDTARRGCCGLLRRLWLLGLTLFVRLGWLCVRLLWRQSRQASLLAFRNDRRSWRFRIDILICSPRSYLIFFSFLSG